MSEIATLKLLDARMHAEIYYVPVDRLILNAARPRMATLRASREKRLQGRSLEEFTADRGAPAGDARGLRTVGHAPQLPAFLGGRVPNDHPFSSMASLLLSGSPSVAPGDRAAAATTRCAAWFNRCAERYGGTAHDSRMKPLFA